MFNILQCNIERNDQTTPKKFREGDYKADFFFLSRKTQVFLYKKERKFLSFSLLIIF